MLRYVRHKQQWNEKRSANHGAKRRAHYHSSEAVRPAIAHPTSTVRLDGTGWCTGPRRLATVRLPSVARDISTIRGLRSKLSSGAAPLKLNLSARFSIESTAVSHGARLASRR